MSRVAVIGPGALGCLFAARLARSGIATWLVDYDPDRADHLNQQGIIVEEPDDTFISRPEVVLAAPDGLDLAVVLTKTYSTPRVALPSRTPVLTLQNGLGNAEMLEARLGSEWVLAGATWEAVTYIEPGRVRHAARGKTRFGPWKECPAEPALDVLRQAGFDAGITEAPRQVLWEKVIINAAINPLTALLNVNNGALLDHPASRTLLQTLAAEAAEVARAEGCCVPGAAADMAEHACDATRENISSMLQDIRNRKRTEIDAISGEIMRRASAQGLPATQTALMYHLVCALETI